MRGERSGYTAGVSTSPVPFVGCFTSDASARRVFVGLPDDSRSSYRRGPAAAPPRIRAAYDGRGYHATTESGVDLEERVFDAGDIPSGATWSETAARYRTRAEELFRSEQVPFFAGGDHAVTMPVLEALAVRRRPVHVVQIDAHPDLYEDFDGDPTSHACVIARALELPHVASVTQLGIRTMNATQRATAERHAARLTMIEAADVPSRLGHPPSVPETADVYLTIDLDGLDPAFAPGVSHPVPGGLTSRQVLDLIRAARWTLVGMDVVELNPSLDLGDRTAVLAARLLHEGMGSIS